MICDGHLRCTHSRKRKRASAVLDYITNSSREALLPSNPLSWTAVTATPFRPLPLLPKLDRPQPFTPPTPFTKYPLSLSPQPRSPTNHTAQTHRNTPSPQCPPFSPAKSAPPSLSQRLPSLTASQPAIASWFVWRWGLAEEKGERRWIVYGVDI